MSDDAPMERAIVDQFLRPVVSGRPYSYAALPPSMEQVEFPTTVHLSFDEFELGYLAFGLAVGPWGGNSLLHSGLILDDAIGERRQDGLVCPHQLRIPLRVSDAGRRPKVPGERTRGRQGFGMGICRPVPFCGRHICRHKGRYEASTHQQAPFPRSGFVLRPHPGHKAGKRVLSDGELPCQIFTDKLSYHRLRRAPASNA